jgi:PAS domain S-box-containing protein
VQAITGSPLRLPARFRRPLIVYLLALLVNGIALSLTLLLVALAPASDLHGVLLLVGIVVVALTCGVGPSVLATGIDLLLLVAVLLAASLSGRQDTVDWVFVVVLVVSEIGLSFLAGQSNWALRKAEALADSLGTAKASSDMERQRLRTLLDVLPVPVAMVDTEGRIVETTPANETIWGDPANWLRELAEIPVYPALRPDTGQPVARDELPIVRALTYGQSISDEELDFEDAQGQRKVILNSATPIRDRTGAIRGAVSVIQDITERRRLERQVTEHAAQLEAIFESIADGVLVTDRQGRVMQMNQASRTLLGLEPKQDPTGWTLPQLEGLAGFAGYTPEGRRLDDSNDPLEHVRNGEVLTKRQSVDSIVRTRAGRETRINTTGGPIRDATGSLLGGVFVARDVTEQRRLEQHTRDSLDALLAMAEILVQGHEQTEQGTQALDPTLRPGTDPALAEVAARLAELTRRVLDCRSVSIVAVDAQTEVVTPVTVVGRSRKDEQRWWAVWEQERKGGGQSHLRDVLPPDAVATLRAGEMVLPEHLPESFCCWKQLSQVRQSVLVPMRVGETLVGGLQIEGDDRKNWEASGDAEADTAEQKGALVRAVARLGALVLERERLLRERTQAQATELALRETQAQMEAFLATAAHDLRTPVTAIVGYLYLAERQIARLSATVQENYPALAPRVDAVRSRLDEAGDGTDRLTRLLNLLFDMASMRAGNLELRRAPGDLAALVQEQVAALRVVAPERTIRLHTEELASEPILVEADADRVGQVLTNYVTNALKYSPPDQPVDVTVTVHGTLARVAVHDQGPGLPEAERTRVWEAFHRAPGVEVQGTARNGVAGGSLGLGLHICKAIVEAHGGQVGVESAVGQGSTFWFTLPLPGASLAPTIAS